jgi:hypothetical protein
MRKSYQYDLDTKRNAIKKVTEVFNMTDTDIIREFDIPTGSQVSEAEYTQFMKKSYSLIQSHSQYLAKGEDINSLELAHLIPDVPETMLAIYLSINDAVCNKGLVTPFLPRHGHNNVFVFDPQVYAGGDDVPGGTLDARAILVGFEPPNTSWNSDWTYVMITDPNRSYQSLWQEKGYIDMIPAKFEDFTFLSDPQKSKICVFVDPKAFEHPVNKSRNYLKAARKRGEKEFVEFVVPEKLSGENDELVPVILDKGQKLYIATTDFGPCEHMWTNIHPDNQSLAVVNENSAVPLDLVIAKPAVNPKYSKGLIPAKGSADMTTDWFYRGSQIYRKPLVKGLFAG